MALEISEFPNLGYVGGVPAQLVMGSPSAVRTTAGTFSTLPTTKIIRISGTGTITWPNALTETFASVEYRVVSGATVIVSA